MQAQEILLNKISNETKAEQWLLRLYIAGQTSRAKTTIANLEKICEEHLAGRYEIQIIDLLENPHLASEAQIIAIPTLLRLLPAPMRKLIGDLSNYDKTLMGLDLLPKF